MEDVEIAWKALTLPILEPLTTDMLQKVTKIVKGKIFMKKQVFRFEGPSLPYCCMYLLKVSKFQNEFMKSSFLPTYELNIVKISALTT